MNIKEEGGRKGIAVGRQVCRHYLMRDGDAGVMIIDLSELTPW